VKDIQAALGLKKSREHAWSVAQRKKGIYPGDRFLLLQQGKLAWGVIGFGQILSEPYPDRYALVNKVANFVDIALNVLIDPVAEAHLRLDVRTELRPRGYTQIPWAARSSGYTIDFEAASEIEQWLRWKVAIGRNLN
jgi:hypothetical protein